MPKRLLDDSDSESDLGDDAQPNTEGSKRAALLQQPAPGGEPVLTCTLPPRCVVKPRPFYSITAFEAHYERYHSNVCTTCLARLPTSFFLSLHIEESHDPLFASLRSRYPDRPVYRCFVETCAIKFPSISSRRRHLISAHAFPEAYRFNLVTRGLPKHAQSLLFPNTNSTDDVKLKARPTKEESDAGQEVKPNRAQRRAQARQSSHPPRAGGVQDEDEEVDPKRAHALAVTALFKSIEVDADALEPAPKEEESEDVKMDELAEVMQKTRLVPKQIQFGRKH